MARELRFKSSSFGRRLKGMLGVDFYRLFHKPLYTNTWNIIEANTPIYAVSDMGEYANMNMVFIFGWIMVSTFIGHDYKSGYMKRLFTTHAKKQDYMMSKSITCAFAMACMCITHLIGGVFAGLPAGTFFVVNVGFLILAILSKMIMSMEGRACILS